MITESDAVVQRNAVRVDGSGHPVVFVHGYGCDQTVWDAMAGPAATRHRLIRYDITGMGRSDYGAYDQGRHGELEAHADDLIEVMAATCDGPAVLVGHSVGATIAVLAAAKAPGQVSHLVLIGPNPCYIDDPPYRGGFSADDIEALLDTMKKNYQGWANHLATAVAGDDHRTQGTLEARFCRNDPAISRHFAEVTFLADNREDLSRVSVPTLVIQSRRDAIAPMEVGEYVRDQVPDAQMRVIDCTGHAPHMSHPSETWEAIEWFLGR